MRVASAPRSAEIKPLF